MRVLDVRPDLHRAEHADLYQRFAQFTMQRLGERHNTVLGDRVGTQSCIGDEARERCREDDVRTPGGPHDRWEKHLDTMNGTPEIDADHPLPVLVRCVDQRPRGSHAGVEEQDVDGAEVLTCARCKALDVRTLGDVSTDWQHLGAGRQFRCS